jgi:hypothetical protein
MGDFSFRSTSTTEIAFERCPGARCAYLKVIVRSLCPRSLLTVVISTPAITR